MNFGQAAAHDVSIAEIVPDEDRAADAIAGHESGQPDRCDTGEPISPPPGSAGNCRS
jgi:hypothetical protein